MGDVISIASFLKRKEEEDDDYELLDDPSVDFDKIQQANNRRAGRVEEERKAKNKLICDKQRPKK